MKPCLIDETLKGERITLIENEKVVSGERATQSNNIPTKVIKEN